MVAVNINVEVTAAKGALDQLKTKIPNSTRKALINLIGALFFLLPVSSLIFYASWDYVWASWAIGETSSENNGLPYVYLLKLLLLIMPTTLFLQGIAEMLKSIIILNQTLNSNRHK